MLKIASVFGALARPVMSPVSQMMRASATQVRFKHSFEPKTRQRDKKFKGRVPVRTGGSTKGSTVVFGEYGLRLKSEGVRIKAIQLKEADNSIMRTLRPLQGTLYRRLHCGLAVCVKGNETRMGKGKGAFEYWAVRVPTGKVAFEISGNVPEQVARDALRVAKDKLPGNWEFVTKTTPPKVGFKPVEVAKRPQVNFFEAIKETPTKKWANYQFDKNPEVRKFLRR